MMASLKTSQNRDTIKEKIEFQSQKPRNSYSSDLIQFMDSLY